LCYVRYRLGVYDACVTKLSIFVRFLLPSSVKPLLLQDSQASNVLLLFVNANVSVFYQYC
jgi:hypothetical protein